MKRIATDIVVMAAAGVLFLGVAAQAQRDDSLQVGARHRITLPAFADRPGPQFPASRWLAGALVGQRRDTLLLQPHPSTGVVAVSITAVDHLERSRGVSRAASGFEGAVGGALVGALLGSFFYDIGVRGTNFNTRWQAVGIMAANGAGGGLFAGVLFPTERWKRVATPKLLQP